MLGFLDLNSRPVFAGLLASLVLAACGGGGGASSDSTSATSGSGQAASDTQTSTAGSSSSSTTSGTAEVTLSNLPSAHTQSTSASIAYEASSGSVYCRLDSYLPIACPNPFVLGAATGQALNAGTHTVDYYVDTGSGIDLTKPTASYSWVVEASASSSTSSRTRLRRLPLPPPLLLRLLPAARLPPP
jgi:hypothetical protein